MTQPKRAPLACCPAVALPLPCARNDGTRLSNSANDGPPRPYQQSTTTTNQPTMNQPPTTMARQYKASIIVPDCPGPERVLTISSDLTTVLQVLNEVVPNLEENGSRHGSDEIDVRMLVHQSQAGCVIGKGGLKIKELREVSYF
ncbi:hypothetical protein HZH66_006938 [Vespula vulgaris]|uniref:K Homology domain-containing protein n=1 Tax=Vespula vulgaris TaxID=7454 RepID=A0A834K4H7_VESVU|nr:hypothetical protein HZH66_006938 [Vespula vulgaris]